MVNKILKVVLAIMKNIGFVACGLFLGGLTEIGFDWFYLMGVAVSVGIVALSYTHLWLINKAEEESEENE